ncbi:type II secretion system protein GspM [Spongiibacter marinus]|uniref:type II secretion system protein GspM n=1 Tax=Spongiibacter marinus TaxID=354246 RepID=UPI0035BE167D
MNALMNWFESRNERERTILLAGLIAGVPLLIWLAVWQPLISAKQQSSERLEQRREAYLWMQDAAAKVRAAQRSGRKVTTVTGSTQQQITSAARQYTVAISRIEPQSSGRYAVQVSNSDYNNIVRFIDALVASGMPLHTVSMSRLDVPGKVSLRVVLGGEA